MDRERKNQRPRSNPMVLWGLALTIVVAGLSCDDEPDASEESTSTAGPSESNDESTAAGGSNESASSADDALERLHGPHKREVVRFAAQLAHTTYLDAAERTERLRTTVEYLLERPSPDALDAARQAWLATREPFGQGEVFAFDGSPAADVPLHSRPVSPAHLEAPEEGLLRREEFEPTRDWLDGAADEEREHPIAGFYLVEFLLWGDTRGDADPRSHRIFGRGGTSEWNAKRLRQYLKTTTGLLVDDVNELAQTWDESGDFGRAFVREPDRAIRQVVSGMLDVNERLVEKQLAPPLQARDPGLAPARFSNATGRELVARSLAIRNLYHGTYTRTDNSSIDGPGLTELVAEIDSELDERVQSKIEKTVAAIRAIPTPFSEALRSEEGRSTIEKALRLAGEQRTALERVAERFELRETSP